MSMVVFPFRAEAPDRVARNLAIAARHDRVTRVTAVAAAAGPRFDDVAAAATEIARQTGVAVDAVVQDRIGDRRPGKGDGMNTGLRLFVASGEERLHFYDADITNFDASWVDGAEHAADEGFPVVRHYFPRASTDAMVTWMITRPGLALTHPATRVWRVNQPLGGELLVIRRVAEALVSDAFVSSRSDWGIDTAITHATVAGGFDIYEHFMPAGKQHTLYESLEELRAMVVECFEAIVDLRGRPAVSNGSLFVQAEQPATDAIAHAVAYDVEATLHLLTAEWGPDEVAAAALLPDDIGEAMLANIVRPTFAFMGPSTWGRALGALLGAYRREPGWRALLFRMWVARVLAYTTTDALKGHRRAMELLNRAVEGYADRALELSPAVDDGTSWEGQEAHGGDPGRQPEDLSS